MIIFAAEHVVNVSSENKGLTNSNRRAIISKHSESVMKYRGVEQLEARRAHNPEVVGSSPASATIKEPGIDTKSVPGLFFICWDISVCFGDIPFIFAQKC